MNGCCQEQSCRRKKPFLIRRSGLSNRVYLLTSYTIKGKAVVAGTKHDITEEIEAFMASEAAETSS